MLHRILCAFPALFPTLLSAAGLTLVERGRSPHTIVLPAGATPAERRGAEEFQRFVAEMSGARLPIRTEPVSGPGPFVFVGWSRALEALQPGIDYAGLGPEDFALKTLGNHLAIAGGRPRGTMYGVSTLLEKLGCRWFTRDAMHIPKHATLVLPKLDELQRPAFEMRWPGITEAVDKEWAARNKLNGAGLPLDASTGGRVECSPCGHSFHTLIPPAKFFATHPEYFALVDGRRRYVNGQLCLTNPGVVRAGVEQIRAWLRERPDTSLVGICQEDWGGWCECENCRRVEQEEGGAHSGPIVRFVNALAEAIAADYPQTRILTYAYQYSEPAPTRTAPHPNVRIQLAPISACIGHAAAACPRNRKLLLDNLTAWTRLGRRVYLYGYATNFAHYLYPLPDMERLAGDLPHFHRLGVTGVYYEGSHQGEGGHGAELRAWIMAKLMWNPGEDVSRLVNEYLAGVYGAAAAAPLRRVFDLLHREVRFPPEGRGQHLWIDQAPWIPTAVVNQIDPLYAQALAAASTESARRRIRRERLWVEYTRILEARRYRLREGWYEPSTDPEALKARFRRFWQEKTALGIGAVDYSGLKVEEEFPKRLVRYPVETLENEVARVVVVPGLSGRVVRWTDKRTGRSLLREPNPAGIRYPDGAGEFLAVHPDPGGDLLEGEWRVTSREAGRALVLTGLLPNGLAIRRELRLLAGEPRLAVENTVENRGGAPMDVELRTRFDIEPRDPDQVTERQSPGEVTVRDPGTGVTLLAQYAAERVKVVQVARDDRHGNRASVGLRTPLLRLDPGESARLDVTYRAWAE
jgi:hypothetical protein